MTSTVRCLPLMKYGNMVMSYRFPAVPRHQSNFGGRRGSPVSHDRVIAVLIGVENQSMSRLASILIPPCVCFQAKNNMQCLKQFCI